MGNLKRGRPWQPILASHPVGWQLVTLCCRLAPVVAGVLHITKLVDFDVLVEAAWREAYSWSWMHWCMAEANVAAGSFAWWIFWYNVLDELPPLKRFRFVFRASSGAMPSFHRNIEHFRRVFLSAPVYLLAIAAFHLFKRVKPLEEEAPTAVRLVSELVLGLAAYDFFFYWVHLAMHRFHWLPHGHEIHHTMRVDSAQHEYIEAEHVVHHSLVDGFLQVIVNIVVQNLSLFGGLPKHKMSRLLHNIVVTYLLSEAHSGLDLPWAVHRILPGIVGGAYRHEIHHHSKGCCFHQFFCYLDDLLGLGPSQEIEAQMKAASTWIAALPKASRTSQSSRPQCGKAA
mmetsp:Transcript_116964/g.212732  ORF Transcript_116964/g.212732 Transcript_116964/m.212732 type:complete len:341 (-) Transcript_116964:50-1072(-)